MTQFLKTINTESKLHVRIPQTENQLTTQQRGISNDALVAKLPARNT